MAITIKEAIEFFEKTDPKMFSKGLVIGVLKGDIRTGNKPSLPYIDEVFSGTMCGIICDALKELSGSDLEVKNVLLSHCPNIKHLIWRRNFGAKSIVAYKTIMTKYGLTDKL